MSVAHDAALSFARSHQLPCPITESALDAALGSLGISVIRAPSDLPVREFRRGHIIGIRADQCPPWRLWLKAHALGHFLLHRGDQQCYRDRVIVSKQEQQAEAFAGWLLLGQSWATMAPMELAEYCGLPQERVERWTKIAAMEVVA